MSGQRGGEVLVFLTHEDVSALIRGAAACVNAANLPTHDPGGYVHADGVLRCVLQVARNRLAEVLGADPWDYLHAAAWPEAQEVSVWLTPEDLGAVERAACACRLLGTVESGPKPERWEWARRVLERLLARAGEASRP